MSSAAALTASQNYGYLIAAPVLPEKHISKTLRELSETETGRSPLIKRRLPAPKLGGILVLATALFANALCFTIAAETPQDNAQQQQKPESTIPARASVLVKVVDESGKPVEGALITPCVLRCEQTVYLWIDEIYGPAPIAKTDAAGEAQVSYPVEVPDGQKTESIGFYVDHPQFCRESGGCVVRSRRPIIDHSPQPPSAVPGLPVLGYETKIETRATRPVVLHRGGQVEISAYLDGSGKPATGVLVQTFAIEGNRWTEVTPGVIRGDRVPADRHWLRLALLSASGPSYFSDSMEMDVKIGQLRKIKAPLKPGVRLEGQVDPAIPRPIHNGWVSISMIAKSTYEEGERARLVLKEKAKRMSGDEAVAAQLEALRAEGLRDPWEWATSARIGEDGSFVFPALPSGEAGIVAGCDGFLSTDPAMIGQNPPPNLEFRVQRSAHSIAIEGSRVKFTVPMEKTGAAEIKIVDPAGKSVSGATLYFICDWHWQDTYHDLGWEEYGTPEYLHDPSLHRKLGASFPRYVATSDATGIARVPNLPGGKQHYIVTHPDFSPPKADPTGVFEESPSCTLLIVPGEISKRTAKLRPK